MSPNQSQLHSNRLQQFLLNVSKKTIFVCLLFLMIFWLLLGSQHVHWSFPSSLVWWFASRLWHSLGRGQATYWPDPQPWLDDCFIFILLACIWPWQLLKWCVGMGWKYSILVSKEQHDPSTRFPCLVAFFSSPVFPLWLFHSRPSTIYKCIYAYKYVYMYTYIRIDIYIYNVYIMYIYPTFPQRKKERGLGGGTPLFACFAVPLWTFPRFE